MAPIASRGVPGAVVLLGGGSGLSCGARGWGGAEQGAKVGLAQAGGLADRGICRTQALDSFQGRKLASLVAQALKASAYNAGGPGSIPRSRRSLEQEMATHSGTHAWKIPWTEELDRLQSMGSQRVGHY